VQLSTAELRAVIAFQNSPSGRAFIAATQRARTELDQELATRNGQDRPETFEAAMLRLKAKYESDPK
jgi:hypothetical protein